MYLVLGLLVLIGIILLAIHIVIPNMIGRTIVVVILSVVLFMAPTMHTALLGLLMIACEIIINYIIIKVRKEEANESL